MGAAEAPLLAVARNGRELVVVGNGRWVATQSAALEGAVDAVLAEAGSGATETVRIDLSGVRSLDTVGAVMVDRLVRSLGENGAKIGLVGLERRFQPLLNEITQGCHEVPPARRHLNPIIGGLDVTGRTVVATGKDSMLFLSFIGAVMAAFLRVLVRPTTFRWTSMVFHLERAGLRAVPIIALMTFLIGCIIAQQGIFHFRRFGATTYVVDMVGILTLRELGVLIVSIMVAGRSGSAFTAELGAMKMREEVDALRVMGFDPNEVLVLPRLVALIIAVPLLTFIGSMCALFGGGLVAWLYGGISPEIFINRLREAISLNTFEVGMIKAPFMAAIIGLIACMEGMRVGGSSESLGTHTTASVVKAIFLVIVVDGLFAMFFAAIDM
ncbi:ABC transporter permease [Ancylobacter defluvii]|uniref:ABC transporter permease n=1 Tax=Ancylobacter defluvii TaxID=1282440 RepID=A0A9W6JTY7_9HYPH|nr:MlaE family lipid ABC transporter permease subunit [Ancylobacter defluvii]MBS7587741.1 MlaE family lipid ABC transporter permease subunit [Ancylobacter defluvii]GLK82551.1 ABC transporter permease [Ancylobacter defluvii]